jgi:bifunctional non-homologous end joining protein LigD
VILPAPMLLHEGRRPPPFDQPGWIYELKFDGYRMMAGIDDKDASLRSGASSQARQPRVRLMTRRGADATRWFPEVAQGLARLAGGPHILDGEVCVLDERGVSDFNRLQDRARRRCFYPDCDPVVFCAFDLLALDGRSLIGLPVEVRKAKLAALLTPALPSVLYVGHFDAEHGRVMFEQAVHPLRLEGLVAKRLGSPYRPGERSADWVKVKRPGAVPPARFRRL